MYRQTNLFDELDNTASQQGEVVSSHLPCPDCGSSDALTIYTTNTYCFSCGLSKPKTTDTEEPKQIMTQTEFTVGKVGAIKDRNLTKDVVKFYGVSCILDESNNIIKHIYPYYTGSKRTAQKIRVVADKTFFTEGTLGTKMQLFGQQLFNSSSKKYLIITEGELDAMAAYQMAGGIWPCVSVPNGAQSALTSVKANLEFINMFEHIVLCFDNDEQGREASIKVAKFFESGKCKIIHLPTGIKDACDMLLADKAKDFIQLVYNSEPYKPEGIVDLYDLKDRFLERRKKLIASTMLYPFKCLNDATYGIRTGELVILTAETGIGKTSLLREVQDHLLKTTQVKIGVMYIEEPVEDTFGLSLGVRMSKPIHLPDTEIDLTELDSAMNEIGRGRVYSYEHFGSTNLNEILYRIRYMKKVLGCNVIILDHISMLIDERYDDERRALDNIVYKLKLLSVELDVAILAVAHLNREGKLRGSAQIEQLANICIRLERDKLSDDFKTKTTSKVIIFKNRFVSREGLVGLLTFNPTTNRLEEENGSSKEKEGNQSNSSNYKTQGIFEEESSGSHFRAGTL